MGLAGRSRKSWGELDEEESVGACHWAERAWAEIEVRGRGEGGMIVVMWHLLAYGGNGPWGFLPGLRPIQALEHEMHAFQESNHRVVDALKSNMFHGLRIVRSVGADNLRIRTSLSNIVTALAIGS